MDKVEKIRAEIERYIKDVKDAEKRFTPNMGFFDAKLSGIYDVMSIVASHQQEQPRPDHYTKVREIKTGKEFWAEYSIEAAEWYEAGTGNAYSISDVEIVKEQQEVDLEKEIDRFFEEMPIHEHENIFEDTYQMIARHFYELGKNSK